MLTSCTVPSVMWIKVGMLPCRSSSVCILTAALCLRNLAHGNSDRHRSIVVESNAYRLCVEIHANGILRVQRPRDADQHLGEIGIDAPVVTLVGVGERGARTLPAESNVIQLAAHRAQARLDVAQAFAVSQLREGHRQILVPARETSLVRVTAITGDTLLKLVGGQVRHELSEYSLADIHPSLSAIGTRVRADSLGRIPAGKSSNRKIQNPTQPSPYQGVGGNWTLVSRTAVFVDIAAA